MNDEVNNDDGVKCAAKETAQRLLRSKKAKQVQQLTNVASDNNLLGTAKDVAFKMGLLEQMHQMNQQMQEQNIHLSMANCANEEVKT